MPTSDPRALATAGGYKLQPAGYTWDAIRAPIVIGNRALQILGHRSGAVLEDPSGRSMYWFVPPGTAASWALCDTSALGRGVTVVVPPKRKTLPPGPYWRICPSDGALLTNAGGLLAALQDALAAAVGLREPGGR